MAEPSAIFGKVLRLLVGAAGEDEFARADSVRDERPGHECAAELFDEDAEVEEGEAGAALLLRDHQSLPAKVGHLLPERWAVALLVLFHGADVLFRAFLFEELAGRVLEKFLFFAEAKNPFGVCPFPCVVVVRTDRGTPRPRLAHNRVLRAGF